MNFWCNIDSTTSKSTFVKIGKRLDRCLEWFKKRVLLQSILIITVSLRLYPSHTCYNRKFLHILCKKNHCYKNWMYRRNKWIKFNVFDIRKRRELDDSNDCLIANFKAIHGKLQSNRKNIWMIEQFNSVLMCFLVFDCYCIV